MSVTRLETVAYLLKKVGQSEKWSKILNLLGLSLVHDFSKSIISRTAGPKNFLRGFLESAMNSVQDRLKNKKWKKFFRQVDLSRGRFLQKVTLKPQRFPLQFFNEIYARIWIKFVPLDSP